MQFDFAQQIQAALNSYFPLQRYNIRAERHDFYCSLQGVVPTYYLHQLAGNLALNAVEPHFNIVNNIEIKAY